MADFFSALPTTEIDTRNGTADVPFEELFTPQFFIFAVSACFLTSVLGLLCNVYLLIKFSLRDGRSTGFQKICLVKTVPNIIVCSAFLFWAVPLTALRIHYDDVSVWINNVIGCLAGTLAYLLTPMLQVCMACNRFYVLYFPFGIKPIRKVPMSHIVIIISVTITFIVSMSTLQEGCGYVYDPEYFQWRPELAECADQIANWVLFVICGLAFTSNSFNVATATRLLMNKMVGMSIKESKKRRRKWMVAFIQSVLQDCLHLIDIVNATYIWKLNDSPWFEFLFLTLSFIVIYTLDGLVMLAFHTDVHPVFCRQALRNKIDRAKTSFMIAIASH